MVKKYVWVTCVAVVLALMAVAGVSALETTTKVADAASYVTVRGCTGTYITHHHRVPQLEPAQPGARSKGLRT